MVIHGETRIGVYGLAIDGEQILLARVAVGEVDAGRWTLPGGGLEFGEDPIDGLRREFFEETGIEASIRNPLGVFSYVVPAARRPSSDRDLFALQIIFRAEARGTPVAEAAGSTDRSQWWLLSQLAGLPLVSLVTDALALVAVSPGSELRPPGG